MTKRFVGPIYDRTLGAILNYESLAANLHSILTSFKLGAFVDLACGTGQLLKAMDSDNGPLKLFGVDFDKDQLTVAKERCQNADLVQGDLLSLNALPSRMRKQPSMVHLGFSFLNTLEPKKRLRLLKKIRQYSMDGLFAFEIQNEFHQKSFYENDVWYDSVLKNGVGLHSMSTVKGGDKSRRLLIMKFSVDGKTLVSRSTMYGWRLDDCLSQCEQSGFSVIKAEGAKYRRAHSNVPTHWFVLCQKAFSR